MITYLQERHRPLFESLTTPEIDFVWTCVTKRWPADTHAFTQPPVNPEELFTACKLSGLDHARVILSFASMNGSARPVLEKLIGAPIKPWAASVEAAQETAAAAAGQGASSPATQGRAQGHQGLAAHRRPAKVDTRVVVAVAPQPHRVGSLMHTSYEHWSVGDTVQQCRDRGVIAMGARRDIRRGYVKVEAPR